MTRKSKHKNGKRRPDGQQRDPVQDHQPNPVSMRAPAGYPPAPEPLPLTVGHFLRGLWNVSILLPLTLWPIVFYFMAMPEATTAVMRDNTYFLGYSAWIAWLIACIAGWNMFVLRRPGEPPWASIMALMLGMIFGGQGLFAVAGDWDRQHDINRRWRTYLYTMQVTYDLSGKHGGARVVSLHAKAPVLNYYPQYYSSAPWETLCADVYRGWLGGEWAAEPHACAERPGQRMATWADLLHSPPPPVVVPQR